MYNLVIQLSNGNNFKIKCKNKKKADEEMEAISKTNVKENPLYNFKEEGYIIATLNLNNVSLIMLINEEENKEKEEKKKTKSSK